MFVSVSKPDKRFAQVESNIIERSKGHGIIYGGSEGVVVSKNKINHNSKHAISLTHPSEITIVDNSIRNNKLSGINVELGVCCTIQGNGIYDNLEYGITTSGNGVIKENDIFGHQLPSLLVRSSGDPHVILNRMHAWKHECVHVEKEGRGVVERNEFYLAQGTKTLFTHPDASTIVKEDNTTIEVEEDEVEDDLENETLEEVAGNSETVVSTISAPRPLPTTSVERQKSAPFFTSEPVEKRRRSNPISSVCILL